MNGGSCGDGKKKRKVGGEENKLREGSIEEVEFEQQKKVEIMVDQRILFQARQRIRPVGQDLEIPPKFNTGGSKFQ